MENHAAVDGVVYLDNNATTRPDPAVVSTACRSLEHDWANPSSSHLAGVKVRAGLEEARRQVAEAVSAAPHQIFFMSGGTEACNMAIWGSLALHHSRQHATDTEDSNGSRMAHIITSDVEHDAVARTLDWLERRGLCRVSRVSCADGGCVDASAVLDLITVDTCLVSIMLANNETGVINDLPAITGLLDAHELRENFWVFCDAAQAVGKIAVDVNVLRVDLMTIVGHKFHGPRIGALFASERCLQARCRTPGDLTAIYNANDCAASNRDSPRCLQFLFGGGQESGLRPGTENTAMCRALGTACQLVTSNLTRYTASMTSMRDLLEHKLLTEGVAERINLRSCRRLPNTSSVVIRGHQVKGQVTGQRVLARCRRLQASTGAACHENNATASVSHVLLRSGVSYDDALRTIRLSVSRETTRDDIEAAVDDLSQALASLAEDVEDGNQL